jgi:hypothetical protein
VARFVARVDGAAVVDAWTRVARAQGAAGGDVCVFLVGAELAPASELAHAIAERRRNAPPGPLHIVLVPVDAADWQAHVPQDAPEVCRSLIERLKTIR